MLLRFFKSYQSGVLTIIIIMASGLWLRQTLFPLTYPFAYSQIEMPLYHLIVYLTNHFPIFSSILSLLVSIYIGLYMIRLNTEYIFIAERTYLPAFFFILFLYSNTFLLISNPALYASLFILFACKDIIKTLKKEMFSYSFFDASFFIGIASLIYLPSLVFLPMIWLVLAFLRPFHWREWLYSILGIGTVLLILGSIYYLTDKNFNVIINAGKFYMSKEIPYRFNNLQLIFYAYSAFLLLLASIHMIRINNTTKIQARKVFMLWLLFFLVTVAMYFIPNVQAESIVLIAIPLSYLLTNYFISFNRGIMGEILLWIFLILFSVQLMIH